MWKKVALFFLALLIVRLLFDYFRSSEFQKYADENKAQWTCTVNNVMGDLYVILSRYQRAEEFFRPIIARCPNSSLAEKAEFKMADCLDKRNLRNEAAEAYRVFVEKYPQSSKAKIAEKNLNLIRSGR